ncbi:MAG: sulfatase-like hydrolase/transferase [Opitutales bacterium]|nr:sulfatase-like hydrolase/transferase [Opitutales bacterium]
MQQPNILLIATDHWPWNLFSGMGHPVVQTPTLDRIALAGTRFGSAYSECPVCIPARRTLMTGMTPRSHGDRLYKDKLEMPDGPTLAGSLAGAGYQCYATGKLHVHPQRDRIGFHDVQLHEEGRRKPGVIDDYEWFLADAGQHGQAFAHGMGNNNYEVRPWHLADNLHPTNWTTEQTVRFIKRRDPRKPGFWYCSYAAPHPPLTPLREYLDLYRRLPVELPESAAWAAVADALPFGLQQRIHGFRHLTPEMIRDALRGFYALVTHIDHQIRLLIGTLREEGLLSNTVIAFTSDHGDMLGWNGLWGKRMMYDGSNRVPLIFAGNPFRARYGAAGTDDRLTGLQDLMPTLLDLAGVPVPGSVDGLSLLSPDRRAYLYGECSEDETAVRMIATEDYKLIYHPSGNRFQLFDRRADPREGNDLWGQAEFREIGQQLAETLAGELYGDDLSWLDDDRNWRGIPLRTAGRPADLGLQGQRGIHFP